MYGTGLPYMYNLTRLEISYAPMVHIIQLKEHEMNKCYHKKNYKILDHIVMVVLKLFFDFSTIFDLIWIPLFMYKKNVQQYKYTICSQKKLPRFFKSLRFSNSTFCYIFECSGCKRWTAISTRNQWSIMEMLLRVGDIVILEEKDKKYTNCDRRSQYQT